MLFHGKSSIPSPLAYRARLPQPDQQNLYFLPKKVPIKSNPKFSCLIDLYCLGFGHLPHGLAVYSRHDSPIDSKA